MSYRDAKEKNNNIANYSRRSFLFLGGASRALAANGKILVPAGRKLTNVIVIYDTKNPAPQSLQQEWAKFN